VCGKINVGSAIIEVDSIGADKVQIHCVLLCLSNSGEYVGPSDTGTGFGSLEIFVL